MKLIFLDAKTIGDDLDLSFFDQFGDVVKYSFSTPEEVPERVQDADVIIVNKIEINETTIGTAANLKLVCFGDVVKYSFSTPEEVPERVQDADVIIVNKIEINETTIGTAANLKLVCVTATGTNNLDKEYLDKRGIAWRNVAGYSTESVAQHTFAMLFYLLEHLRYYDDYVKEDHYTNDTIFTHFEKTFYELKGKTWGIIG